MKDLQLPKFNIPDLSSKKILPETVARLIVENVRRLHRAGLYRRLRQQLERQPGNTRFVLK